MAVPLLEFTRQHGPLEAEFRAAFDRVLATNHFILGPEVTALEREIAAYTQTRHAIGMSSGTDALIVAMMALGIGPGDEVLCPVFTFFSTAGSIARLGATPVWVDVLPDTFNIDLGDAERKITARTKAIVPVHLFGQACDMECLMALARQHELKVIEDAAQSIGARFGDRPVGSIGDFGAYSFYPTKNLGGFGDGGMLVTNDDHLADMALWLRNHGMNPKYHHRYIGGNFRLDALQAAMLRIKLPHLPALHEARRAHAAHYDTHLADIDGLVLPYCRPGNYHVYNQYTIRITGGRREALRAHLAKHQIGSEIYYPISLDRQECFQGVGRGGENIRIGHQLAEEVLSIPVFPEMTSAERDEVVAVLRAFF